ncbi:MAG: polyphosphate kinase 2 family protein [Gemmatimonadota bacterium]|nr:polyphosphate kinase 2 family protein [Gemmatimonadota bacterium]
MKLKPVTNKSDIRIRDSDAHRHTGMDEKKLEQETAKYSERISDLQRVLYADGRRALLIVLQGRDASGKDGTIRKVFGIVNPQGCFVARFTAPSQEELQHDFLWRVHHRVPALGMIGIFNRSHYEDVLVPRVHGTLDRKVLAARYDQINDFEAMLAANGVAILKFFLHISRDEQKKRLSERLSDPEKNWKFDAGDLDDRGLWDEFGDAYRKLLAKTSTDVAPWFIVPADDKDVRNLLIAHTIADRLQKLKLRYPKADPSVLALDIE